MSHTNDTSEQRIIIRLNIHEQYSTVASLQRNKTLCITVVFCS